MNNTTTITPHGIQDTGTFASSGTVSVSYGPTATGYPDLALWRPDVWKDSFR